MGKQLEQAMAFPNQGAAMPDTSVLFSTQGGASAAASGDDFFGMGDNKENLPSTIDLSKLTEALEKADEPSAEVGDISKCTLELLGVTVTPVSTVVTSHDQLFLFVAPKADVDTIDSAKDGQPADIKTVFSSGEYSLPNKDGRYIAAEVQEPIGGSIARADGGRSGALMLKTWPGTVNIKDEPHRFGMVQIDNDGTGKIGYDNTNGGGTNVVRDLSTSPNTHG